MNAPAVRPAKTHAVILTAGILLLLLLVPDVVLVDQLAAWLRGGDGFSEALRTYYRQGQGVLGVALLATALLGLVLRGAGRRAAGYFFGSPTRAFLAAIALLNLTGALAVQVLLFDNIPHVTDAISHDFQARMIADGMAVGPRPPCPEAFFQHHLIMTTDGKWFSKYTPGHPLLLAAGYALRVPFLPVALCHALIPLLLFSLIRRYHDERTARLVAALFTLSPLAVLLGASFMSHTTFLLVVLAGLEALARLQERLDTTDTVARWRWGFAAGFFWGWAVITRPQDAVIAALMTGVACLVVSPSAFLRLVRCAPFALPGLALPLSLYLLANIQHYGSPLAVGYGFTQDRVINRVYQASFGLSESFTLRDAFVLLANTLYRFDRVALGWLTTVPLALVALARHRFDRRDLALAAAAAVHAGVYFFYDYYGLEYEARYYYNLLPLALLLAARAVAPATTDEPVLHPGWTAWLAAMTCHSALVFWPLIILPHYGPEYEQSTRRLHQDAQAAGLSRALVLVYSEGDEAFRYSSGMIVNDARLRNDIIYARDLGPAARDCLREHFTDRRIYTAQRNPATGAFSFTPAP